MIIGKVPVASDSLVTNLILGPSFAICFYQPANDSEPGRFRIPVFRPDHMRPVGDDAFNIPLVGMKEKPHQRLLIIRIAPGIGFDDDADLVVVCQSNSRI